MILKSILRSIVIMAVTAVVMFAVAGTLAWTGGKVFIAVMTGGSLTMTVWLAVADPALYKDRETTRRQKKSAAERILLLLIFVFYFAWLLAMALDVRWHGTGQMPAWANFAGGAAILAGFLGTMRVFRENTFATAVVKVQPERGHKVIDTGPYALVRHPLYGIALFIYLVIPFTLGSWRGLLGLPVLFLLSVLRTLAEERLLKRELAGYADYMAKVRYRFVPYLC